MAVKGKGKQILGKTSPSASSSGKRKNLRTDSESSGARPKKKRAGVFHFVDDTAKDADFDGEDEDEYEEEDLEWEDFEDFDFELTDIGAKEVKNVKVPGKSNHTPFFIKEEEMDDDELEEAIKERYRGSSFVSFDEDIKDCNELGLVSLATKDLSFWRVKCMIGRERQAAFCLMQKFVDLQKIGQKLLIFSVFSLDHVKGFVYIEADKLANVFEACKGLCILYSSRVELVPRNEAPNLLSIQKKGCAICKGTWVRMKNGKYKGDLAEVVLVNNAKNKVTIKLIPRVDLQAISKKFGGGTSLKASAIPAPRLISSHELEDFRPHIEIRRDRETGEVFELLDGLMLKDGYLYKKVSMGSLIHWGVQPSSAELAKFVDMGKDEVHDVSWLSSIYKERLKKKLPETSNLMNGDKSNQKDGGKDKQRNGFDLDDLVLFGKKGCGIIVDKENDTFKVLKGDVNGSEVVTISVREIKRNCIDKVFIATDRHSKTISIDDVVKVSEGPLEGKEGIVRHMYKGFLFIYDECQSENNGFICAKSEICDLVKKSRRFGAAKSGSKPTPSFDQSPTRASEQEDDSQSFSRNRQTKKEGTFSVGQTLRIRKGPLKGYLCRVIRTYRADITVKLDSLGKILTVDEQLLSLPNFKRDDATTIQSDMFGSQEDQSIGGLLDGRGSGLDNCESTVIPSFGRDSWNAPSTSSFSFPGDHDHKDENQEADPWGSKPSSNGDQGQGAANSWGRAPIIGADNSWDKTGEEKDGDASSKNDADAWNKASNKGETSTDGWQGFNPKQNPVQTSTTKGASNGWASTVDTAVGSVNDVDGWSKLVSDPGDALAPGEDVWNKTTSKGLTTSNAETGGWGKGELPCTDAGGGWNMKGVTSDWNKETSGNDKAKGFGSQSGNWASAKSGGDDNVDSWDQKGKGLLKLDDDSWGHSAASLEKKADASKAWKAPSTDEKPAAKWGDAESSLDNATQRSSWDNVKTVPSPVGWEKTEQGGASEKANWGSSSGWSKAKETVVQTHGDWKAGDGNPNDSDWGGQSGWSKETSSNENGKSWGQGNSWNQQKDFDSGRGSERGRGRGRYGGRGGRYGDDFAKTGNSGGDWRSGRGGGRGRNDYNRDNSDSREFGRGRGRGRGRAEGRGQFESSDWRNKQESSDVAGFSNKSSSSWGGAGGSSWTKSRDEHDGSKNDMNASHASSWSKDVSTVKQVDEWNKDVKNDSWTAKTSDDKISSWGESTKNATDSDAKWDKSNTTSSQADGWKIEIKGANTSNADWVRGESKASPSDDDKWTKGKSVVDRQNDGWGSSDWSGKDSFSKQSSDWSNGGVSNWNKQSEGQGNSESWSRGSDHGRGGGGSDHGRGGGGGGGRGRYNSFSGGGSDFGRGGGRGRSNSFSGTGSDFGRGGGRGRDSSFSGRGRGGRGRNSGGRYGWNRDDGGQNGNDNQEFKSGGSWGRDHGTSGGENSSLKSLGNADKGSLSSWNSEGENKPAGWSIPGSGWGSSSAPAIKPESGKSSWNSSTSFGGNTASGWESGSAAAPVTANAGGATPASKTSGGGSGWTEEPGNGAEPKNDPWGSITPKGERGSDWNNEGQKNLKNNLPAVAITGKDALKGSWEKTDSFEKSTGDDKPRGGWEDGDSNKLGSWDRKGSSSNAATDSTKGGERNEISHVGGWEKSTGHDEPRGGLGGESSNSNVGAQSDGREPNSSGNGDNEGNSWGKAASSAWGSSGNGGGNAGW